MKIMIKTFDLMVEYLRNEGYRPDVKEFGATFRAEGSSFVYFRNEGDNEFMQLCLPGIYEIENENERLQVLKAMDKANSIAKVVKCASVDDSVWVFFEILLDGSPELEDIVPRALAMLKNGQNEFYNAMNLR